MTRRRRSFDFDEVFDFDFDVDVDFDIDFDVDFDEDFDEDFDIDFDVGLYLDKEKRSLVGKGVAKLCLY